MKIFALILEHPHTFDKKVFLGAFASQEEAELAKNQMILRWNEIPGDPIHFSQGNWPQPEDSDIFIVECELGSFIEPLRRLGVL